MKLKVNSPGVVLGGQTCRPGKEIDLDEKYLGQLIRLKNNLNLDIEILERPKANFALNYIQDNPDSRDFVMSSPGDVLTTPTVVDYSSQMSPVKDQGKLGSCVAQAVVAVKEWQERKEHLQKEECNTVYSKEEEIVVGLNCCNQPNECIVDGCDCDCHTIEITEAVEEFAATPEGKKSFFKKLFRR